MKMGKVIEKLQGHAAVRSITDGGDSYVVLLNEGYASDGKVELLAKSAHEARLFVDAASNGTGPVRATRKQTIINDDGDEVVVPLVPERVIRRYPGIPLENRKPIWEHPRGFCPNEAEGKDAYERGYEKDSHVYGQSAAAKDFEGAWEAARRKAEAVVAEELKLAA